MQALKKVRLNLEIGVGLRATMEDVREMLGADSVTEAIRRSVYLAEGILSAAKVGDRILVHDKKGNERELIVVAKS